MDNGQTKLTLSSLFLSTQLQESTHSISHGWNGEYDDENDGGVRVESAKNRFLFILI